MTTPFERTLSVIKTEEFLKQLQTMPRIPREVRETARSLLRHFPTKVDLEISSETNPNIWGFPDTGTQQKNLDREILELTILWNDIVQVDRNVYCYWSISKKWSYGDPPYYTVESYGYTLGNTAEKYQTYWQAAQRLILYLKQAIMQQIRQAKFIVENPDKSEKSCVENAQRILKLSDSWMKEQ